VGGPAQGLPPTRSGLDVVVAEIASGSLGNAYRRSFLEVVVCSITALFQISSGEIRLGLTNRHPE